MRTVDSVSFENGIATLTIPGAQVEDRGSYVCEVITEGFEPVRSLAATLNIIGKKSPELNYLIYKLGKYYN